VAVGLFSFRERGVEGGEVDRRQWGLLLLLVCFLMRERGGIKEKKGSI